MAGANTNSICMVVLLGPAVSSLQLPDCKWQICRQSCMQESTHVTCLRPCIESSGVMLFATYIGKLQSSTSEAAWRPERAAAGPIYIINWQRLCTQLHHNLALQHYRPSSARILRSLSTRIPALHAWHCMEADCCSIADRLYPC